MSGEEIRIISGAPYVQDISPENNKLKTWSWKDKEY